jgi:D-inositol-3-phosphate glycosyltransferase
VHTSPLDQPGTGDAGGLNVYVVETSKRLAELGVEVEIFTRATSSDLAPVHELVPGVTVRHLTAGPFEGLSKEDLPAQLCALTGGLLRVEAQHDPGYFDVVHSHYWLSGHVGWLATERWDIPLVHSAHTLAKVKNLAMADDDAPEPMRRVVGEQQVVDAADRLVANTAQEARDLVELYDADVERVITVAPGVDLEQFRPGEASGARTRLGIPPDAVLLLFVGRLQPLKAPDVLLRAAQALVEQDPSLRDRVVVAVVGGPSGSGLHRQAELESLAGQLDVTVRFEPPAKADVLRDWYTAADLVAVPSHNESFGLVALEAQACGTPVVATRVGGLTTTVRDGVSGILVDGHSTDSWAAGLRRGLAESSLLSAGALEHAEAFSWSRTADGLLAAYRDALVPASLSVAQ